MVRQAWLGFLGVAMLLGACGKSEGSGAVPREQLPTRVADIVCDGVASCCKSSGFAFDVATCKRAFAAEIDGELDEELSPNVRYDADAAGACIDTLKASSRCGDLDAADDSACERIFVGTLPIGAVCNSSSECREGSGQSVSCFSEDGQSASVCTLNESTPERRGKQGESCVGTCDEGDTCDYGVPVPAPQPGFPAPMPQEQVICYRDNGLYCDYAAGTCQPLLKVGATCGTSEACAGNAFCDYGPPTGESGTCTAPRADGQPCGGDSDCVSRNCDDGDGVSLCRPANQVSAELCAEDFDDSNDEPPTGDPGDPAMPAP